MGVIHEIFQNKLQHAPYLEIVKLFRRSWTGPHALHADASLLGGGEAVLFKRGPTPNLRLHEQADIGLRSALFLHDFR